MVVLDFYWTPLFYINPLVLCSVLGVAVVFVVYLFHYNALFAKHVILNPGHIEHVVISDCNISGQESMVVTDSNISQCADTEGCVPEVRLPLTYNPAVGPSPRIGCSMAIDNSSGIIIIGGGLGKGTMVSDVNAYSTCTDTWIPLTESNVRLMYANMAVSSGSRIYMFGGVNDVAEASDTVYGYDFDDKEWVAMTVTGPQPSARFNSSLCAVSLDCFALFGGRGSNGTLYNDVWIMKIMEDGDISWECVGESCCELAPRPREAHAAVVAGDLMIVLGGCSDVEDDPPSCMISAFDLSSKTWVVKNTAGDAPPVDCLVGGSMHYLGDGTSTLLVIPGMPCPEALAGVAHGGTEEEPNESSYLVSDIFNSVFTLDISVEPYVWTRIAVEWVGGGDLTVPPGSRSFYGSALDVESGLLYIFGGLGIGSEQDPALGGLCVLDCAKVMGLPTDTCSGAQDNAVEKSERDELAHGVTHTNGAYHDYLTDLSSSLTYIPDDFAKSLGGDNGGDVLPTCSVAPLATGYLGTQAIKQIM